MVHYDQKVNIIIILHKKILLNNHFTWLKFFFTYDRLNHTSILNSVLPLQDSPFKPFVNCILFSSKCDKYIYPESKIRDKIHERFITG